MVLEVKIVVYSDCKVDFRGLYSVVNALFLNLGAIDEYLSLIKINLCVYDLSFQSKNEGRDFCFLSWKTQWEWTSFPIVNKYKAKYMKPLFLGIREQEVQDYGPSKINQAMWVLQSPQIFA